MTTLTSLTAKCETVTKSNELFTDAHCSRLSSQSERVWNGRVSTRIICCLWSFETKAGYFLKALLLGRLSVLWAAWIACFCCKWRNDSSTHCPSCSFWTETSVMQNGGGAICVQKQEFKHFMLNISQTAVRLLDRHRALILQSYIAHHLPNQPVTCQQLSAIKHQDGEGSWFNWWWLMMSDVLVQFAHTTISLKYRWVLFVKMFCA